MPVPDLSQLGRRENVEPPPVLMNPPDDVFHCNDLGVSVEPDGTVILSLRYVVDHGIGRRGDEVVTQMVAAKHMHVTVPLDVFVHKVLANGRAITMAGAQSLRAYTASLTEQPEQPKQDMAARRRAAAGDGDGGG